MKLGEGGEAFFVEPCQEDVPHYLCTSPIPDAESLMSEGLKKLKEELQVSNLNLRRWTCERLYLHLLHLQLLYLQLCTF